MPVSEDTHGTVQGAERALVDAVEAFQDGVFVLDRGWRFIYLNDHAAQSVGREPAQLLGRNVWEEFPQIVGTGQETAYRRAMKERVANTVELKGTLSDRWYRLSVSPVPQGISVVWTDLTERRQAEEALRESEADLRAILNATSESIWLFSVDGVALMGNETALGRWGKAPETIIGRRIQEFMPGELGEARLERLREVARTGKPVTFEDERAGMHFVHSFYPVVGIDGRVDRVAIFSRDISQRRQSEEALRRTEAAVRNTEQIYRAIGESIDYGVWICAPDGRNLYASDSFLKLVGQTQQQCSDYGWGAVLHPEDSERTIAAWKECVRTGGAWDIEHRFRGVDGNWHPILARGVPVRDERGEIVCWAGINLDISKLKATESAFRASEAQFRGLVNSMPQLAWTARPDGFITWYNRRWYEYTGTTPDQMEGWGWQSVHDPAALPQVLERWRASLAAGEPLDMEFPLRRADGVFRRFLTRAFPLKDDAGHVLQWFGTNTDVTELVEAHDALREADRRKDEFLAMLSHELRNPLAPIRNSVYILEHAEGASEQAARARTVLQRQSEHLTRMVDDLLDVTRITRGRFELRRSRCDLRDVVLHACDVFRMRMQERGIAFHVMVPEPEVRADIDATRIEQVIGNLVHNASKYTRRGEEVAVTLVTVGREAEIRIRDSGMGIEAGLLPKLFTPFVQGERTLARTEGGLGLGLAMVKGIVELHGGKVRAESAGPGKGAEFILWVPLGQPEKASARESHHPPSRNGQRVLVVDDNADAAESLADILRMLGHEAEVACDGPTALARIAAGGLDVVFCDIGLPGMDGYQVAQAVRGNGHADVRLIALTGYAQAEDVRRAMEAGFDAHVAKPPDTDELARLLSR